MISGQHILLVLLSEKVQAKVSNDVLLQWVQQNIASQTTVTLPCSVNTFVVGAVQEISQNAVSYNLGQCNTRFWQLSKTQIMASSGIFNAAPNAICCIVMMGY